MGARMTRPTTGLIATAALLSTAAVLVALPNAALGKATRSASNSQSFTDSTGETPSAPDITTLSVSNDDSGNLTFTVNIPNRPTLTSDMAMFVFLDTDNNPNTGDPQAAGADFLVQLLPGAVNLFPWTGTTYGNSVATPSLTYSWTAGVATIHLSDSALKETKEFNFGVEVDSGIVVDESGNPDFTNSLFDVAPDPGHGTYAYQVLTTLKLTAGAFTTSPKPAKSGKSFSAGLAATENDTGGPVKSGTVTCTATVAGKHIPAAHKGSVANGVATCVWPLPKKDKGLTIRGTITLTVKGVSVHHSFSNKIT
jgi:hypothetical protein